MKRKIIITIIIAVAIAALGVLGVQFVRLSQENEKQQEDLKAAEREGAATGGVLIAGTTLEVRR